MTLAVVALLALSVRNIMPVIGRDLMPPMDTGIIKAHVKFSANETVEAAEKRIAPFLAWLHRQPEVEMSSVAFGSEPGVLSLGAGSLPTEAMMTINCVDRFHRKASIWQLEDRIRARTRRAEKRQGGGCLRFRRHAPFEHQGTGRRAAAGRRLHTCCRLRAIRPPGPFPKSRG